MLRGDHSRAQEAIASQAARHSDLVKRLELLERRLSVVETATPENAKKLFFKPQIGKVFTTNSKVKHNVPTESFQQIDRCSTI